MIARGRYPEALGMRTIVWMVAGSRLGNLARGLSCSASIPRDLVAHLCGTLVRQR